MRHARSLTIGALVAACALVACQDGLLRPAAPPAAALSMVVTLERTLGGASEAFDRADGALIRFSAGGEVRRAETLPFSSAGTETVLRVDIPLRQLSEEMTVDLELQSAGRPLFRGSTNATFSSGVTSTVRFSLTPVIASVSCAGPPLQFGTYGSTQLLGAAALFATGDTVPDVSIAWSSSDAKVATVTSAGLVSAVGDGDASVTCAGGDVSATRSVKVLAVVSRLEVAPPTATLILGDSVRLVPTLRDSAGHVITTARPIAWASSNPAAATVDGAGLVRGVGPGSAQVTATSAAATGTASITVGQAPDVVTQPATSVTASGATLNGTANPHGSATQAWFQYGTSATLSTFAETPVQALGSATTPAPVGASVANLQPITDYYYRIVASNSSGTTSGAIVSFRTGGAPPTLSKTSGAITVTCGIACFTFTSMSTDVNPNGLPTSVWFEYSTDSTFQSFSATPSQSAGSGTTFVTIGASVGGSVFFRAVARNALGTVRSAIMQPTAG